jgi:hypothetical protein
MRKEDQPNVVHASSAWALAFSRGWRVIHDLIMGGHSGRNGGMALTESVARDPDRPEKGSLAAQGAHGFPKR